MKQHKEYSDVVILCKLLFFFLLDCTNFFNFITLYPINILSLPFFFVPFFFLFLYFILTNLLGSLHSQSKGDDGIKRKRHCCLFRKSRPWSEEDDHDHHC